MIVISGRISQDEYEEHEKQFSRFAKNVFDRVKVLSSVKQLLRRPIYSASINNTIAYPLYRATSVRSNFDIGKASTFSHPPRYKTKLGRANRAGNPVLYTASDRQTALFEVFKGRDDKYPLKAYLSTWQPLVPYNSMNLAYPSDLLGQALSSLINESQMEFFRTQFDYLNDKGAHFRRIYEALGLCFLRDNYRVSSTIAHHFLNDFRTIIEPKIPIHALRYPSLMNKFNSMNVAFHPAAAEDILSMKVVEEIEIDSIKDGKTNYRYKRIGIPNNRGDVYWYDLDFRNPIGLRRVFVVSDEGFDEYPLKYSLPRDDFQKSIEELLEKQHRKIVRLVLDGISNFPEFYPGRSITGTITLELPEPIEVVSKGRKKSHQRFFAEVSIRPEYIPS